MAIFQFFKMAAVRHLGFSKVGNFNFRSRSQAQYASSCQISRRLVKTFRRYGRFSIFQDGDQPPSWICFTRVWTTHEEYLVVFVTVQNLVVIGAAISIVCKFNILHVKLENAYSRPQNWGFWGILPPKWQQCERDPQKAHP